MTRLLTALVVVLVAVATPPALAVTGFRLLAHPWFVSFEYDRDGFPADRYGLSRIEREELALIGLASIRPGSEGIGLLEGANLPDGSRAFDAKELAHMADVRALLGSAYRFQLVVALVVTGLAFALSRTGARVAVPYGLLLGALATLGVALAGVPVILLGFDGLFVRFHELFFAGDSWRFARTDTLLRLYPERFWQDTAKLVAAIAVGQAAVLTPLAWWWSRRATRSLAP